MNDENCFTSVTNKILLDTSLIKSSFNFAVHLESRFNLRPSLTLITFINIPE